MPRMVKNALKQKDESDGTVSIAEMRDSRKQKAADKAAAKLAAKEALQKQEMGEGLNAQFPEKKKDKDNLSVAGKFGGRGKF